MKPTLVVIGNGMVGHRFVEEAVARGLTARWRVIVLGDEPTPAYDRVHLSSWFDGGGDDALRIASADDYAAWGAELRLGARARSIDPAGRTIELDGERLGYDALVLATGARPFVPPIPGAHGPGRFVYRTIDDLRAIAAAARPGARGVVVGGGLLGLEAAGALRALGVAVTVVELAPHLLAAQLDGDGAAVVRRRVEDLGVVVRTSARTTGIEGGGSLRVVLDGGEALDADLVVYAAGVRPNDDLARAAGVAVAPRGGIEVDAACATSAPAVWAIGDCAAWQGRASGLVGPGYAMARVVAARLDGDDAARFDGGDPSTRLKLLGVEVASLGDAHGAAPGAAAIVASDPRRGVYRKLVVDARGARVLGAILVGDLAAYGRVADAIATGAAPPGDPLALLVPPAPGAEPAAGGDARVCTCNGVSRGALCAAIAAGACDLPALRKATRAGSGCGGCLPEVGALLRRELEARGVAVSRALCEHFDRSRQELHHLVRVERIRDFATLLARHGRGGGCEVCKPAVASILASCWNEHVLDPAHVALQDSNDHFLANLQKDGTYSVVPRVPGGEITPAQLVAIGTIAAAFDLYTKITGGQRIDLFGARVEQLPAIWRALIDAGFESGHAYGKAVRTVKTCVGSTWCRYGVQDAVGLGIRLEHRYKGLRAPHKLKLAVSGCTRECAEAQGKDVGVIATERGYNLYVGGNGGARPRHAELLAEDLDEPTLIRLVDRFLMFYVRTADRLQRTARWLEALDGGLGYLREVIVEDRLGIAAELEAEMAAHVASYRCEWRAVLDDPAKLRRFRTFVNTDQPDPEIAHVRERGQRRPARPDERVHLRVVR